MKQGILERNPLCHHYRIEGSGSSSTIVLAIVYPAFTVWRAVRPGYAPGPAVTMWLSHLGTAAIPPRLDPAQGIGGLYGVPYWLVTAGPGAYPGRTWQGSKDSLVPY